jgi:hypothetical protein
LKRSTELRQLFGIKKPRRQFLKRTETDAIGLTQGSIDRPSFGHAHFGVVEDQGRNVPRMGISIADKPAALSGLIDSGLEDPEVLLGAAEWQYGRSLDPTTMTALS